MVPTTSSLKGSPVHKQILSPPVLQESGPAHSVLIMHQNRGKQSGNYSSQERQVGFGRWQETCKHIEAVTWGAESSHHEQTRTRAVTALHAGEALPSVTAPPAASESPPCPSGASWEGQTRPRGPLLLQSDHPLILVPRFPWMRKMCERPLWEKCILPQSCSLQGMFR